jgi:hypothetical protein
MRTVNVGKTTKYGVLKNPHIFHKQLLHLLNAGMRCGILPQLAVIPHFIQTVYDKH